MLRLAADENFNNDIIRGLRRRKKKGVRTISYLTLFARPQ